MILTPFVITSFNDGGEYSGGSGYTPTPYHVPYARVHKKPMATPSFVPVYSPIDIDVPVVKRCPSAHGPRRKGKGRCRADDSHNISVSNY